MPNNAPPSAGEVRALANQLLSWADHLSARAAVETLLSEGERRELALGFAEAAREAALLRSRLFPGMQFGNVSWEVILELFIRTEKGFRVPADSLTFEGDVPADAIRRSLHKLRELGIVEETRDRFDPRVSWLSLSDEGTRGMTTLLIETFRLVHAHTGALASPAALPPGVSRTA